MGASTLREHQLRMARFLRDPEHQAPPEGMEPRRLKIYQDLVYNNIEGFISGGFPVLRSLYEDADWHGLVRAFIDQHRCHTPYFLEISQEFLQFLMEDFKPRDCDPAFMAELAHYEWVELALDVSEEELPEPASTSDILTAVIQLSPLAWLLSYQFPVHRIGPGFRPAGAQEPTYLAVYRDRDDQVRFMELNAATTRLLELVRENTQSSGSALLRRLANELNIAEDSALAFGSDQLRQLWEQSVVVITDQ